MNLKTFTDNFHLLADTPNGIPKLREMILQLAVMGKLVPQDPNDEPASVLLEKITKEKERLVAEGKIKKQKLLPSIDPHELPHELPEGWEWVRLDDICHLITDGAHRTPTYISDGIPFLSVRNVTGGFIDLMNVKFIPFEEHKDLIRRCKPEFHDVLFTKVGTTGIAKVIDVDQEFSIFVSLALLKFNKKLIFPFYMEMMLNSPLVRKQSEMNTQGVGNKNLVIRSIKKFLVPLPSVVDQKRIVAKVDELMALCNHLEEQKKRREALHTNLNSTCLHALTSSKPIKSKKGWTRIRNNFDLLYDTTESVAGLRQSILQLAIMGKLVPQDPNDEPASVLLVKIAEEKEKLVAEGRIKKPKALPTIHQDKTPYDLPKGWAWVRMENISKKIHYGYTASANYNISHIKFLRITDIQNDHVRWSSVPGCKIKEEIVSEYSLSEGDILVARTGGTIGKTYLVSELEFPAVFASYLIRIIPIKHIRARYLKLFLGSQLYWDQLHKMSMGTGQPNVNGTSLKSLHVPLAPLSEQKHIVAKVDELVSICDQLESKMRKSFGSGKQLMTSMINNIYLQ